LKKTYMIMKSILHFGKNAVQALEMGKPVQHILATKSKDKLSEVKFVKDYEKFLNEINDSIEKELKA